MSTGAIQRREHIRSLVEVACRSRHVHVIVAPIVRPPVCSGRHATARGRPTGLLLCHRRHLAESAPVETVTGFACEIVRSLDVDPESVVRGDVVRCHAAVKPVVHGTLHGREVDRSAAKAAMRRVDVDIHVRAVSLPIARLRFATAHRHLAHADSRVGVDPLTHLASGRDLGQRRQLVQQRADDGATKPWRGSAMTPLPTGLVRLCCGYFLLPSHHLGVDLLLMHPGRSLRTEGVGLAHVDHVALRHAVHGLETHVVLVPNTGVILALWGVGESWDGDLRGRAVAGEFLVAEARFLVRCRLRSRVSARAQLDAESRR
mmetsp:Transcript_23667/g.51353  ORF Transcript_23667/g.51353 Transcript_23667/m.51353 type:complete len:317 (+) Transcript_23667:577-1527(+)